MKQTNKQEDKRDAYQKEIERRHKEAVSRGEDTYQDPVTGFVVFTQHFHRKRGTCCGSGCRHCPY